MQVKYSMGLSKRPNWCQKRPDWCQKRPNWFQKRPYWCQKRPNWCQKRPNWCQKRHNWCQKRHNWCQKRHNWCQRRPNCGQKRPNWFQKRPGWCQSRTKKSVLSVTKWAVCSRAYSAVLSQKRPNCGQKRLEHIVPTSRHKYSADTKRVGTINSAHKWSTPWERGRRVSRGHCAYKSFQKSAFSIQIYYTQALCTDCWEIFILFCRSSW